MREIKFRAWVKDTKGAPYMVAQGEPDIETLASFIHHYGWQEQAMKDGDIVLMQFTGLKDKNGMEIYEGDVVRMPLWNHDYGRNRKSKDFNCEVRFIDGRFDWCWPKDYGQYRFGSSLKQAEVIGNIYENPELLR